MQSGNFSYLTFYEKRIRRIIPNLVLLLLFVAFLGWFYLLPNELENLGSHIKSSATFVQNFQLLNEIGYFTEDALRKPLLHLWSLAIEEQFYIVFPILCTLFWRFWKSKFLMVTMGVMISVCSIEACLLLPDKNVAFYFPLTRFWELGAGILLAALETFGLFDFRRIARPIRHAMSVLGFLFIAVAMGYYRAKYFQHPGFFTLIPVLGAVLLIAAQPDAIVNRTLLSWRPMTFIGLISYSLYLWHWPLLAYLFICEPHAPKFVIGLALALSFVLATIVYFQVEQPMRRSRRGGHTIVIGLLILLIGCFVGGRALVRHHGYEHRDNSFMTAKNVRTVGEWTPFSKAPSFKYEGVRVATPKPKEFPSIFFAGDSHNAQYYARAEALSLKSGKNVGFIGQTGCVILSPDGKCKPSATAIYRLIEDPRVKTLVIVEMWGWWMKQINKEFSSGLERFKDAIGKRPDLKVYILLDYPWTTAVNGHQGDRDPLQHVSRWKRFNNFVKPYPAEDAWKKGNEAVKAVLGDRVTYIDPTPYIYPDGKCNLVNWYRDDDHLQPLKIKANGVWLDPIFE